MKHNFEAMSRAELRSYILEHRDDDEAFYAYVDKSKAEGNWVKMPAINLMDDLENYPEFIDKIRKDGEQKT